LLVSRGEIDFVNYDIAKDLLLVTSHYKKAQKVYFCFISTKNIRQRGLDQSSFRSILHQGGGFTVEKESIIKKCREFGQEIIYLIAKSKLSRPKTETK
jgi:hypothetical protein